MTPMTSHAQHKEIRQRAVDFIPTRSASFEVAQRRILPAFRRSGLQARPEVCRLEVCRNRRAWRPVLRKGATSKSASQVFLVLGLAGASGWYEIDSPLTHSGR